MHIKKLGLLLAHLWVAALALYFVFAHGAPWWVVGVTGLAIATTTWQIAGNLTEDSPAREPG